MLENPDPSLSRGSKPSYERLKVAQNMNLASLMDDFEDWGYIANPNIDVETYLAAF